MKERLRRFFADSTAPGRAWAILAMLGLGCLLVAGTWMGFRSVCPWPRASGTVCEAVAKSPPWTLLTSLAAAPALVVTWWWRTVHKDQDIGQKAQDLQQAEARLRQAEQSFQLERVKAEEERVTREIEKARADREERSRRFLESVRLMSEEDTPWNLGAIYSLESLARDAEDMRFTVLETLCGFIRRWGRSILDDVTALGATRDWNQRTDVTAAFKSTGRLPAIPEKPLDLRYAKLSKVECSSGSYDLADLSNAQLQYVRLTWCTLKESLLVDANLVGATLQQCDLCGTDLTGAKLRDAILANCDLTDAIVCDADLRFALIESSTFRRARYSAETTFPEDFDPTAAQMVLVDSNGFEVRRNRAQELADAGQLALPFG